MRRRNGTLRETLWGGLGLLLLLAGWSWVNAAAGPLVLPALSDTARAFGAIILSGVAAKALAVTLLHAVGGAALGAIIGFGLGVAGGMARPLGAMLRTMALAILGVPPVAWIVLALLWFGPGLLSPLFTVTVTTLPILFAATFQGMRARSPQLAEMAQVFALPPRTRFVRLLLPELAVHVAPALSTTFALSWKVALTAELLGDGTGIGGTFATARAHLDLPEAMAWVVLVVIFLIVTDGLVLGPLRRWIAGHRGSVGRAVRQPGDTEGRSCVGIGVLRGDA